MRGLSRVRTRVGAVVALALPLLAAVACERSTKSAPPPAAVASATATAPAPDAASAPSAPDTASAPAAAPGAPGAPSAVPAAPQELQATGGDGSAVLAWKPSPGATGYEVIRGGAVVARVTGAVARDVGLRAGEQACYTVVAIDAAGGRSAPSTAACAVAPDATAPQVPGGFTASLANPTSAHLRWSASADDVGVTGYEILRDGSAVATAAATDATVRGLAPARRHCFAVRALDAAGNRSAPTPPACVLAPDVTAPSAPPTLEAKPEPGRVSLRWSAAQDDVGVKRYEVLRDGAAVLESASLDATDGALKVGVRACYTVVALDAAGNRSPESLPACTILADTTPPTVPAAVFARPDGESAVALAWKPSTDDVGVTRYELLRDGKLVATSTEPQATVKNLPTAVEACHTVRACDAASNCSAPSAAACATPPDLTPPSVARVTSATADSDSQVTVHWKPSVDRIGVVSYALHRDGELVAVFPGTATTGSDVGLRPATRYCYTVLAEDAAGNASRPGEPACATTPDLKPPTIPQTVAAAARSGTQVVVVWSPSTDDVGVAGYEVVRDGEVVAKVDRTVASVSLLTPETQYCHAVRAFDAAGNRSKASATACTRTARKESPTAPMDVRARTVKKRELLLSWDPSPDANVVYVVYWDGTGHGERSIGTTPERSFKVFGKAAGERHCYRIAALDDARGESPRTFPICAAAATDTPTTTTAAIAAPAER